MVLVTPLLGLKGNLEMTLASRLSTHANLGHMDTRQNIWTICSGNLCLIQVCAYFSTFLSLQILDELYCHTLLSQVQAIVVGFLSSVVAIVIGVILPGEKPFDMRNALLLSASSILTASIASVLLGMNNNERAFENVLNGDKQQLFLGCVGLVMVGVILLSKKLKANPDNIATPIAGTVGDVTTLGLLAWFASFLYSEIGKLFRLIFSKKIIPDKKIGYVVGQTWGCPVVIAFYLITTPLWLYLTYRNEFTRKVLTTGWTPVICAMLISRYMHF